MAIPSMCALSLISKLNAGSVSKIKVTSTNTYSILVSVNKRINDVNKAIQ